MKIRNIHTGMEHQYNDIDSGNQFLETQENPGDWYFVQSLYCDGSGYNGVESGYVVTDENQEVLFKEFCELKRTNNECEYLAFVKACELAFTNAEIFSDSQLVVFQITGDYRIKEPKFLPYVDKIRKLIIAKNLKIGWIERNKNIAGKYIESMQNLRNPKISDDCRKSKDFRNKHPTSHFKMKERLENYSNQDSKNPVCSKTLRGF